MYQFENKPKWVSPELHQLSTNLTFADNCSNYPSKLNTNPNDGQYAVAGDNTSASCGS